MAYGRPKGLLYDYNTYRLYRPTDPGWVWGAGYIGWGGWQANGQDLHGTL